MFIYNHNVYKHTEPDFWWKIKHTLSIKPALICVMNLIFFFEFNHSTKIIRVRWWNKRKIIFL